jgi:hypothetical protein
MLNQSSKTGSNIWNIFRRDPYLVHHAIPISPPPKWLTVQYVCVDLCILGGWGWSKNGGEFQRGRYHGRLLCSLQYQFIAARD